MGDRDSTRTSSKGNWKWVSGQNRSSNADKYDGDEGQNSTANTNGYTQSYMEQKHVYNENERQKQHSPDESPNELDYLHKEQKDHSSNKTSDMDNSTDALNMKLRRMSIQTDGSVTTGAMTSYQGSALSGSGVLAPETHQQSEQARSLESPSHVFEHDPTDLCTDRNRTRQGKV